MSELPSVELCSTASARLPFEKISIIFSPSFADSFCVREPVESSLNGAGEVNSMPFRRKRGSLSRCQVPRSSMRELPSLLIFCIAASRS